MFDYDNPQLISAYTEMTEKMGLWESEKYLITKYFKVDGTTLDVGCGAGRISFALSKMEFKNIYGVDIAPEMIHAAFRMAKKMNLDEGKLKLLKICNQGICNFHSTIEFDNCMFSYNGLWGIKTQQRKIALLNILKLLKNDGIFIFTSHIDYNVNPNYRKFWKEKRNLWERQGLPIDDSFSDLLVEDKGVGVYQHFSTDNEVYDLITGIGFKVIFTALRNEICKENNYVKSMTNNCRFWVCHKT